MDVKKIVCNVIDNYDYYSQKLLQTFADKQVYFTCPHSLTECIHLRKCYTCTVNVRGRPLANSWPIMIGSKLDVAFRHQGVERVYDLNMFENVLQATSCSNDLADIAITCFVINGICKQMPFYITNDVSNIHVLRSGNVVRIYSYTTEGKGQELNYFIDTGVLMLRLTSGEEKCPPSEQELQVFFKCGNYPLDTKVLMQFIHRQGFHIDQLYNKIVFSSGHIFYRLFYKTLYALIRDESWTAVQKQHKKVVVKSIINGDFCHVISKKTIFHKEMQIANKMTPITGNEQLREIGANNKIFVEKKTTCYRDVNFRNYQLIPYLSQTVFFQISEKAKMKNVLSFSQSHIGFLCICGTSESRNVGRQHMLARDVIVSCQDDLSVIYEALQLDVIKHATSEYHIVINSACIPISKQQFYGIKMLELKGQFETIECYIMDTFLFINYKPGILYKKFADIRVTSRDYPFWKHMFGNPTLTYDFITSYMMDLIPFLQHNAFPKNVLTINALRNAILSCTPVYARYFKETVSTYIDSTQFHKELLPVVDEFSKPWQIYMPKINIMFTSFRGMTQEDCIVLVGDDIDCFDCVKAYTIKIKFLNKGKKMFYPVKGLQPSSSGRTFLGTVSSLETPLELQPQSINIKIDKVNLQVNHVFFTRPNFKLVDYEMYMDEYLFITIDTKYPCQDGDKLCSLAGQKGVVRRSSVGPRAIDEQTGKVMVPRLLINPEAIIKRQTMGQLLEMLRDGGRDCSRVINAQGKPVKGKALVGPVFYFPVNYRSIDHLYVGNHCVKEKITAQPVRGRSRSGGMRCGSQEIMNGFRGNGLAACYEEKMIQNSDATYKDGLCLPRSVYVIEEDLKFFKVTTKMEIEPLVFCLPPNAVTSTSERNDGPRRKERPDGHHEKQETTKDEKKRKKCDTDKV